MVGIAFALCAPPAPAQSYTAQIGPGGSYFEAITTLTTCGSTSSTYDTYSGTPINGQVGNIYPLFVAGTGAAGLFGPSPAYFILGQKFAQENGVWQPATLTGCNLIGPLSCYGTTTLDANGTLATSYSEVDAPSGLDGLSAETATETIDLQTGQWTYSSQASAIISSCFLTGQPGTWYQEASISGNWEITLVPGANQPSLAFLNPYACAIRGYSCTAVPSSAAGPGEVTFAPAASSISADGQSAAAIVFRSTDANDSVQLTLAGPAGFSGAIGSLSTYDPNFLSEQASGTTSLTVGSPDYCDDQGNCIFLALLWAPASMSGGLESPTGGYAAVPLTVTASQGTSNPPQEQANILLQPPPLVLVHGLWGKPGDWSLFEQWLYTNYPHKLFSPVDYSAVNYLAELSQLRG